ncbi:hypothetical protein ES332_A09G177400v1 [Gossypium tomentosum]|uniref:Uncharacterized protein n=1 Tax=Gossypium tomentosum TaxID=34277 RepID=A0A5D2P3Q5_GOSTO|nr:hypothetical protein ES332_A09G177400v1 [Gossypium tomentosum]
MGKLTSSILIPVGGVNQARGNAEQQKDGLQDKLVVKRRGGSSGLPIAKDVSIGTRSVYGLDAIFLKWNEGRLGVNKWWILPERGLSSFICHGRCVISRELCTYQCENVSLHEGSSNNDWMRMNLPFNRMLVNEGTPVIIFL